MILLIQTMTAFSGSPHGQTLELKDGFNLIEIPDPETLAAWCALPGSVLYGSPCPFPHEDGPCGGRLDCRTLAGDLTLIRVFAPNGPKRGSFRTFRSGTDTAVPELTGDNCGRILLGADRDLVSRVAHLGPIPATHSGSSDQDFLRAEQEARTAREHAETLRAALEARHIPENHVLGRLRGAAVNLEVTRRGVEKARNQRDEAMKLRLKAETQAGESPFSGQSAESAHREADKTLPRRRPLWLILSEALVLGLGAGKLLWTGCPLPPEPFWAAWALLFLGLPAAFLLGEHRRRKKWNSLRNKRFGTAIQEEIAALADAYEAALVQQEQAQETVQAHAREADALYSELLQNEQAFLMEVRRFAPNACDLSSADRLLQTCAVQRKELSAAEAEAQRAQSRLELLRRTAPPTRTLEQRIEQLASEALKETGAKVSEPLLTSRAAAIFSRLNPRGETDSGDLLYLSVRLALFQLALPAERKTPLLLEDTLSRLDDASCSAVLDWLRETAHTQQTLLFTSDRRERVFCAGKDEVSIQQLTEPTDKV